MCIETRIEMLGLAFWNWIADTMPPMVDGRDACMRAVEESRMQAFPYYGTRMERDPGAGAL